MDLALTGKVALVAAASKGIGRGIATQFAREGAAVVICGRDAGTLAATAEQIRAATGAQVLDVVADVTQPADIQRLLEQTAAHFGRLDALVTNAGGPPGGLFLDLTDEQWEQAFQLNVLSAVRLIRAAVPHLRAAEGGRIAMVTSSSIKVPIPTLALSNTLRAGLVGLMKTLADELAPDILINVVAPGRIDTDRSRALDAARAARTGVPVDQVRAGGEREIPLGRYGTPDEFGRYVAFLCSPANTYVTGSSWYIDGGLVRAL